VPELADSLKLAKMELSPSLKVPFEALIKSIIHQQLSVKAARTIESRFMELIGELTTASILEKTVAELRQAGISRQKASYIQNVARAFGEGGDLAAYKALDSLEKLTCEEIIELFSSIKGVGEWTVQMYLIFGLGRLDVLATGDLGVRKGVQKLYTLDYVPKPAEVESLTAKWRPFSTVGCYLAWRVLDS